MSLLQALILGIVQGATEFLPVSSSGHLVLVPWALGWQIEPKSAFVFDVLVQWGTLAAVIYIFRGELLRLTQALTLSLLRRSPWGREARLATLLLLASLPAAAAGLIFKGTVERAFNSPEAVAGFLLVTAALLVVGEFMLRRAASVDAPAESPQSGSLEAGSAFRPGRTSADNRLLDLRAVEALLIGVGQALALFPGVSRSGATISTGLSIGMRRTEAARFSFLMAVPIMLGAGLVALADMAATPVLLSQVPSLVAGFLAAAVVGALAIRWLLRYLSSRSLVPFAVYCVCAGAAALLLSVLRG